MGLLDRLRVALGGKTAEPQATSTPQVVPPRMPPAEPGQRLTPARLASRLLREHQGDVPSDVLRAEAESVGFKPETIERLILRFQDGPAESEPVKVRTVMVEGLRIVDLSGLESVRMRVKGVAHSLADPERSRHGGRDYLLIPEPDNPADASAVAVYGKGRRVGYISTARAATLAPLLARIGADAYRVTGTGTSPSSTMLWVDVPKVDGLRKLATGPH